MNPNDEAQVAIKQIRGLRKLAASGMHVRRSEVKVLNRLSDEALAIVAAELDSIDNATKSKGTQGGNN